MKIDVRFAEPEEAELIADLSIQTFSDTFSAQNSRENMELFLNNQFKREELILELNQPGNIFLLATNEDRPVGYARLRTDNVPPALSGTKCLEIARLYALKEMIGKGVGEALMKQSIALATALGKEYLWLGVWEENYRAISFYRKWGFEKFDEHPFVLGKDVQNDWLMKKRIA